MFTTTLLQGENNLFYKSINRKYSFHYCTDLPRDVLAGTASLLIQKDTQERTITDQRKSPATHKMVYFIFCTIKSEEE